MTAYTASNVPTPGTRCGSGAHYTGERTTFVAAPEPTGEPSDEGSEEVPGTAEFARVESEDLDGVGFDIPVDLPEILTVARFTFPTGVGYEVTMSFDVDREDLDGLPYLLRGARLVRVYPSKNLHGQPTLISQYFEPNS